MQFNALFYAEDFLDFRSFLAIRFQYSADDRSLQPIKKSAARACQSAGKYLHNIANFTLHFNLTRQHKILLELF